jgi:hypothetical protein
MRAIPEMVPGIDGMAPVVLGTMRTSTPTARAILEMAGTSARVAPPIPRVAPPSAWMAWAILETTGTSTRMVPTVREMTHPPSVVSRTSGKSTSGLSVFAFSIDLTN